MDYGYVIKISSKKIYKEIQLPIECKLMRIGTDISCDVRLYKEDFFESFQLDLSFKNGMWQLVCSDNVYIDAGDVRKLVSTSLKHGDTFTVKYQNSDQEVFKAEFLYDFDNGKKNYDRIIDVSGVSNIVIGSASNSNIVLNSQYAQNDSIALHNSNKGFLVLLINQCSCGVYHNGKKAVNKEAIKSGDFFSIADFSFYYKNGKIKTEKTVGVNGLSYRDKQSRINYPKFNRNTRVNIVLDDEKIEVLDPPAKPQKPKTNWLTRLLPSGVMVIMGIAMVAVSPFMLVSSALGIVTAIMSIVEGKKDFKKNSEDRVTKYNAYIENKKQEITTERSKEQEALEKIYINSDVEKQYFATFSSHLFERTKDDEDFLCVRLGTGDIEAKKEINYKKQERLEVEDDLQTKPEEISKEYKYVHNAPIVCNFKNSNAVGIVGEEKYRFEIMKNMMVDLCARHFQSDVKLFFVAEKKNKQKVYWLRMLPHVYNDAIGIRNIVCDDEGKNILFEYLYKELSIRKQNKKFDNNIVVFLYDEYGFQNHPVSKFVDDAKDLGVTFVFFGDTYADIGQGCDFVVDIKDAQNGLLVDTADKNKSHSFTYKTVTDDQAKSIVKLLAPVYTEEISLEGTLVKNISLFKLLNILTVDDINLDANWHSSQVFKSMAAPIGVSKSGIVSLDLHDKAHGPHGLVAGTTGSGKSEILQTYILSMALLFHPYEVGFVIIDFKGGGMVNQFKNLPHLVGAITNIDGKEIDRSLKSIKAELKKRQRLFADADVNHIDKYIKKFKAGEVTEPLPHFILIVDEFAELKADQPEFMKELISAARIGRSLGVHLILATQKPSGQVDDQIWSNSRFKLCLKVQDQADSNEVLKSPLAAEIKEPGRAYLQVGNNEIFELFQSAYSGAPEKADNSNVKEFTIYSLTDSGRKVPVYQQKKKKSGDGNRTQLEAIVDYVHDYAEANHVAKLPDICLPPLAEVINYDSSAVADELSVPVGIYDDPDNQLQTVYGINIFAENTIIIGSSMSGKTNLLQLILRGIAKNFTPDEVNVYIIDFASMVLKNFESLNHVGGVVVSNEDEKLKNLFKLILEQIATRKEKLLAAGVSNYLSYKEAGNTDLPQIVLMIDNLTALNELYLQDDDTLLTICREGIAVGVSVIVANPQTQGIGYRYMSNFGSKLALFCNDSGEYSSVFDYCRMQLPSVPGRCIIEKDKQHYECQTYLAFEGEKEFERVEEMRQFISVANSKFPTSKANIIPVVPNILNQIYIDYSYGIQKDIYSNLIIGISYLSINKVCFDIAKCNLLGVLDSNGEMGRVFVNYLLNIVSEKSRKHLVLLDKPNKELFSNEIIKKSDIYISKYDDFESSLDYIYYEIKSIYESFDDTVIEKSDYYYVFVNDREYIERIYDNPDMKSKFENLVGKYNNCHISFVLNCLINKPLNYNDCEIYKTIRDYSYIVSFDNADKIKFVDLPLTVIKENRKQLRSGEALLIKENEVERIKTPFYDMKKERRENNG